MSEVERQYCNCPVENPDVESGIVDAERVSFNMVAEYMRCRSCGGLVFYQTDSSMEIRVYNDGDVRIGDRNYLNENRDN